MHHVHRFSTPAAGRSAAHVAGSAPTLPSSLAPCPAGVGLCGDSPAAGVAGVHERVQTRIRLHGTSAHRPLSGKGRPCRKSPAAGVAGVHQRAQSLHLWPSEPSAPVAVSLNKPNSAHLQLAWLASSRAPSRCSLSPSEPSAPPPELQASRNWGTRAASPYTCSARSRSLNVPPDAFTALRDQKQTAAQPEGPPA